MEVMSNGIINWATEYDRHQGRQLANKLDLMDVLFNAGSVFGNWFGFGMNIASAVGMWKGSNQWEQTQDHYNAVQAGLGRIENTLFRMEGKLEQLDNKLDTAVEEIKQTIEGSTVMGDLAVTNGYLNGALGAWESYVEPDIADDVRQERGGTLHETCTRTGTTAPKAIFAKYYSYFCKECDKIDRGTKSSFDIISIYKSKAHEMFGIYATEKIAWFRKTLAAPYIMRMTETIFLHSVCLFTEEPVCPDDEPDRAEELQSYIEALKEVVQNFQDEETSLWGGWELTGYPTTEPSASPSTAPTKVPTEPVWIPII